MQVSVIIINYNTFRLTSDCIRSVITHTRGVSYEIILVDNASSESDPSLFLNEFPAIKLIRNPTNSGFAGGNNLGIKEAEGKFILLLNSDTLFTEDSISSCVAKLEEAPQIGVLGCRMIFPDGRVQYTARKFRSIQWELLDLFRFIPFLMNYRTRSRIMLGKYFRHDEDVFCDWVNGAFFFFRREIVGKLPGGKLDDRFFMYGEDHLWCWQLKSLGYKVYFFAGTTIIHINSGSTDISRHLQLRRTMMKHEVEILRERMGHSFQYQVLRILFVSKESFRNFIKGIFFRKTGRLMK